MQPDPMSRHADRLHEKAMHAESLTAATRYPNLAERIIRVILHVFAIVAIGLAIGLMLAAMSGLHSIKERLDAPDTVATTGCPFGDLECGG